MAQVSLGEILRSRETEAFWRTNSKRVDMLLVDEACRPRHAIECHGGGHYQVVAGKTTPADLRQFVENLISKADTRDQQRRALVSTTTLPVQQNKTIKPNQ